MKKTLRLFLFLMMGFSMTTFVACSEDSEESCDKFDENVGTCSAEDITACCDDGGSCYYLYQNERYENETALATVCASGSAMTMTELEIQLDDFTAKLIDEARTAAICD